MDVFSFKIYLDTYILAKNDMDRREYILFKIDTPHQKIEYVNAALIILIRNCVAGDRERGQFSSTSFSIEYRWE
jgi:hypothetical protein